MLGGRCKFVLSSSGHIQSHVNPPGNPKAKFLQNPHVTADPDEWLAGAQRTGSWWEDWRNWLGSAPASGLRRPRRSAAGDIHPPKMPRGRMY
jgi:polyhydroxyalkanoate synthase